MASGTGPRIAVALDGAGWHPAAWREPGARPRELLTAGYWTGLVREAEAGKLDFVTFEDSLALQTVHPLDRPGERNDVVQGRLDAVLTAARVAPLTSHIGLVPTAVVTHTEPFHLSKAIATLDYVSTGRAGVRVQVAGRTEDNRHFGRREFGEFRLEDAAEPDKPSPLADLFDEAADYVEVLRRLWDSWEDDAEIRDVATGRFIDRDKLHYIDFEGRWFSVRGPSITPRPPQGQLPVVALAHAQVPYELAARAEELVRTPAPPSNRPRPPQPSGLSSPSLQPFVPSGRMGSTMNRVSAVESHTRISVSAGSLTPKSASTPRGSDTARER